MNPSKTRRRGEVHDLQVSVNKVAQKVHQKDNSQRAKRALEKDYSLYDSRYRRFASLCRYVLAIPIPK